MLYLLPFIVAQTRRASNVGAVFGVNLLFGWSGVGWMVGTGYGSPERDPPGRRPNLTIWSTVIQHGESMSSTPVTTGFSGFV